MPSSVADEESCKINTTQQESGPKSSKPGKGPVTPELQQSANQGGFGLPTPDTTPESLRVAYGNRAKQVLAHPDHQRSIHPITPSISSGAPSTEEIIQNRDSYSQRSTHSHQNSEEPDGSEEPVLPPTPPPYLYEEESFSPVSLVKSVYNSVLSFLNLAKQRESRADNARVRDIISLIKAIPTIKRARVGNLTRTLTAKQYGELLKAIEAEDEAFQSYFSDDLRFDYTRSRKRFEIRMPTTMHGAMEGFIVEKTFKWQFKLEESKDENASKAAKTIRHLANADIRLPYSRGPSDTKSPDWRIGHQPCGRPCKQATLVMEIGWTQEKKDLQKKAEEYMRRSKGEIRTVVGIHMREMYLAERRNEKRLEDMYLADEADATRPYVYEDDERNTTGSASILIWRAKTLRNGTVKAECVQDEIFRDAEGNAVESRFLRLPLQDFVCQGLLDSPEGKFEAPWLEISSEDLCARIDESLKEYRQQRVQVVREKAEGEREKRRQKAAEAQSRREREATSRRAGAHASEGNKAEGRFRFNGRLVSARIRGRGGT